MVCTKTEQLSDVIQTLAKVRMPGEGPRPEHLNTGPRGLTSYPELKIRDRRLPVSCLWPLVK